VRESADENNTLRVRKDIKVLQQKTKTLPNGGSQGDGSFLDREKKKKGLRKKSRAFGSEVRFYE